MSDANPTPLELAQSCFAGFVAGYAAAGKTEEAEAAFRVWQALEILRYGSLKLNEFTLRHLDHAHKTFADMIGPNIRAGLMICDQLALLRDIEELVASHADTMDEKAAIEHARRILWRKMQVTKMIGRAARNLDEWIVPA